MILRYKQPMVRRPHVVNFRDWFKTKTDRDRIDEYLSDSASLEDLERRQRLINRNEAPWQLRESQSLAGWTL